LSVKYTLFFDVDPQHRGLLRVGGPERHPYGGLQPGARNLGTRKSRARARPPVPRFLSDRRLAHLNRL
jgi:hypothetical protein